MISKLSRKVTIALVAIVLYCTSVSSIIYIFDQIKYFDFATLWFTFFILSSPMFLIVGIAMAFLFDFMVLKSNLKGLVYIIFSWIAVLPYSAFIFHLTWSNALYYFLFGAIAGLLFYIVEVLFENYLYTKNSNEVMNN